MDYPRPIILARLILEKCFKLLSVWGEDVQS